MVWIQIPYSTDSKKRLYLRRKRPSSKHRSRERSAANPSSISHQQLSKVFFYYILYYIYKLSNCCYRRLLLKPPSVSATAVQNVDRLKSSVENPVTVMVIDLVVSVLPWTILRRLEKRARFSIDRQISPDP